MSPQSKTARTPELWRREMWPFPFTPLWRSFDELFHDGEGRRFMAVEEFSEDGTLVVRAELPGLDPDKDVEISTADGMLNIKATRTEEEEKKGRHFHRRELRYGSFARSLALPDGVEAKNITATYNDGILEVRVPLPAGPPHGAERRVPVSRS